MTRAILACLWFAQGLHKAQKNKTAEPFYNVQGDSMYSILSIDATYFFNITKYKYVKAIHFCVIFLTKKFVLSMTIRIFTASVPTKPLNDAQMRGAFFVYIRSLSKYANGKITALHETLYDRDRLGGFVGKSWTCHF